MSMFTLAGVEKENGTDIFANALIPTAEPTREVCMPFTNGLVTTILVWPVFAVASGQESIVRTIGVGGNGLEK